PGAAGDVEHPLAGLEPEPRHRSPREVLPELAGGVLVVTRGSVVGLLGVEALHRRLNCRLIAVRLTRWVRPSGRRSLVALAAVLVAVVVGVVVVATTRSGDSLDSADVGRIASDAAGKAIDNAKAAPANSAVVYQKILPSI